MNAIEGLAPKQEVPRMEVENKLPIEQQANFKGNYSDLLFSRMSNPVIQKQLLDLMEANEKWMSEHPETIADFKRDQVTNEIVYSEDGMAIFEKKPGSYVSKTRQELTEDLKEGITREMSVTKIDPSINFGLSSTKKIDSEGESHSTRNSEAIIGIAREGASPLNIEEVRDRSVIEAHEKGHVFRNLQPSKFLEDKFMVAFDTSKVTAEAYYGKDKKPEGMSDADVDDVIKGYLFDFKKPVEVMERMSQLKGYFGMKGDEKFTPQHLKYARENYSQDVGLENHMQAFFNAITEESEFAFLKLINSVGV